MGIETRMGTRSAVGSFLVLLSVLAWSLGSSAVFAHEIMYKGTVESAASGRYTQADGSVKEIPELNVKTIDDRSKKPITIVFTVTETTRVFRGEKQLSYREARIQKGEAVSVTIDHDRPGDEAVDIRIAAQK